MTRRDEIIELLSKQESSLQHIANLYGTTLKDILWDIEHIKYSIKPKKLVFTPAFCRKCGFVFKEREKLKPPTKCPRCWSELIEAQLFKIK